MVVLSFTVMLLVGLVLFRDYGISWDEPVDMYNGVVNVNYIGQQLGMSTLAEGLKDYPNLPALNDYLERDHGPGFEYPVMLLAKLTGTYRNSQQLYYLRHLLVFVVSFTSLMAFYKLAKRRFLDRRLALLATWWFFLTPRFFAERFYNSKDAIFLALFTISMYTLAEFMHRPGWRRGIWHGLACGAALGLRVNAVMLVPLTLGGLLLTALDRPRRQWGQLTAGIGLWLPSMAAAAILFWPWLWEAPLQNLLIAYDNMSHFRWDGIVLYQGDMISTRNLPWHYAFVWIALTTPPAYLAAFGLGLPLLLVRLSRSFPQIWRSETNRLDLVFCAWLVGPLAAVVWLHAYIYDGWRHLYFIFPALLLLGIGALEHLWHTWITKSKSTQVMRYAAVAFLLVIVAGTAEPLWRIVQDHPHQQVYFNNFLSAQEIEKGYERDYWGLSYRQGLEWIAQTDPSDRLKVGAETNLLIENNLLILPENLRKRFVVVPLEEATYLLGAFRWHPQPYTGFGWEEHAEFNNGVKVLVVHKR